MSGVVAGVGGYGNSFGVPTVGGQVRFHTRYDGNNLVNAMAVGLAEKDKIFYAAASGVGMPIVYLGSKTGRDGIHGASMASAEFGEGAEEKRPTVQVGDPFSEKLLLEACLEIMAKGCVIAIQDMGAAGLTCSAVEMGAKGNLGVDLELDKVPCRETGMSAYEMMLSESQERMLMVLKPEKEAEAEAIFRKWGLDFAIVGHTTPSKRFIVKHGGDVMADLPIKELGDEAPVYDRPYTDTPKKPVVKAAERDAADAGRRRAGKADRHAGAVLQALGVGAIRPRHPRQHRAAAGRRRRGGARRRRAEGAGAHRRRDAALLRGRSVSRAASRRWPRPGATSPRSAAQPLAITDNLNFGNPEKPEIMGQFVGCVRGIAEACKALDFPVVSGNVSLYNETQGRGILPTPSIGGVGLLADFTKSATLAFKAAGETILLIGETQGWLGQSLYLRDICGREEGAPPPVDLIEERENGDVVARADRAKGWSPRRTTCPTAGCWWRSPRWRWRPASARSSTPRPRTPPAHAFWFGEDQARYLVTVPAERAEAVMRRVQDASVPVHRIGSTGGDAIVIPGERAIAVKALAERFEGWLPAYMAARPEPATATRKTRPSGQG